MALLIAIFVLANNWGIFGEKTARLEIETSDGERAFEGEVVDDMTLLEALQVSALAGNISFKYLMEQDDKTKIMSLDGYSADNKEEKLAIYLNEKKVENDYIHKIIIKPGDLISIKAE